MPRLIAIKIFALLLIIAALNLVYTYTLYDKDLREKSPEILRLRDTRADTDVYYFGESSNVTYKETDSTRQSISELTAAFFPGIRLTNINKYATHAGIYRHWLGELGGGGTKARAVIVTLNLRSFDAAWRHSELETQLQESLVMSRPYPNIINRFMLALQAFDNKTPQQREKDMLSEWQRTPLVFPFPFRYNTVASWDYGMAQGTYTLADGSWDTEKIALACHYIKAYAFNLDENNPRISDFDAMAKHCKENNIMLYLNLMAENVDYADSLVGKELVFLMRQNRDYLVNRYHKDGCVVIDNMDAVRGLNFIDQNWTTEHYDYKGRMAIAARVADALKEQFQNEYKKAY